MVYCSHVPGSCFFARDMENFDNKKITKKKNELRPSSFCLMTGVFYLKGICIMKLRKMF